MTGDTSHSRQVLTFSLANETCGVPVEHVREIIEYRPVTHIPGSPPELSGVVNVRGGVVPVADLRQVLDVRRKDGRTHGSIVILDIPLSGGVSAVGALVDDVEAVLEVDADHVEPAPRIGASRGDLLAGIAKTEGGFILIPDATRLFAGLGEAQPATLASVAVVAAGILIALVLSILVVRSVMRTVGGEPAEIAAIAELVASGEPGFTCRADAEREKLLPVRGGPFTRGCFQAPGAGAQGAARAPGEANRDHGPAEAVRARSQGRSRIREGHD
jgi:purine-binding chemotaxis protein CheW